MDRDKFYDDATSRILAVFPQERFHHNAYIIGGRRGLENLREALDEALDGEDRMGLSIGMALAHPGDDEVNGTFVILDADLDDQEQERGTATDFPVPYYDPRCKEVLRENSVSLSPNESHIMAAGVKSYVISEQLKQGVTRSQWQRDQETTVLRTVYLPKDLDDQLKKLAREKDSRIGDLILEAVTKYVEVPAKSG